MIFLQRSTLPHEITSSIKAILSQISTENKTGRL
jgi:hypothetical protein